VDGTDFLWLPQASKADVMQIQYKGSVQQKNISGSPPVMHEILAPEIK
jgi:hypothetical protein